MRKPTGYVFYRGPSMLDGAPIVGVILVGESTNKKTGSLIQTYILADNGLSAIESAQSGADRSVCGNCPHRRYFALDVQGKKGACYVNLGQGPRAVSDGVRRGIYPAFDDNAQAALVGRNVRLGAYGDPAAIPLIVWQSLLAYAEGWTGYTHQWKNSSFSGFKALCMASVDSESEAHDAWAEGWRTFRVKRSEAMKLSNEVVCPASAEAGYKITCQECMACNGTQRSSRSIVINAHGTLKGLFMGGAL